MSLNNDGAKSYLLPMAFPEGSPMHPAYGAGHATVAGACTTILKAWFKEDFLIIDLKVNKGLNSEGKEILFNLPGRPNAQVLTKAKVPEGDGFHLENYQGIDNDKMTVGGELNKIAANISIGRNMAGVHWYSDWFESIKLGEEIVIRILEEQKITYNEIGYFKLTKFNCRQIVI